MTSKQEVYLELQDDGSNVKELQAKIRGLQARKVSKSTWQIRFRDSETWQTIKDWKTNFYQSNLKQLTDLVLALQVIIPPEEMLKCFPEPMQVKVAIECVKHIALNFNGRKVTSYELLKEQSVEIQELTTALQILKESQN